MPTPQQHQVIPPGRLPAPSRSLTASFWAPTTWTSTHLPDYHVSHLFTHPTFWIKHAGVEGFGGLSEPVTPRKTSDSLWLLAACVARAPWGGSLAA